MSAVRTIPQSIRSTRARALAPRLAAYAVLAIVAIAGVRAILAGPPEQPAAAAPAPASQLDPAAETFAEGFAAAYLSWEAGNLEAREEALAAYVGAELESDAGMTPDEETSQEIVWTAAMGSERSGEARNVSVAARTDEGAILYLVVPVARDERGFLALAGYPALVGPPPLSEESSLPAGETIADAGLETVVERALANYLGGARENLIADLTPDAVVSLPPIQLEVTGVETPTWVVANRRVAALVTAEDEEETAWTLRYELDVRRSDRWYVRGIEADPTLKGDA